MTKKLNLERFKKSQAGLIEFAMLIEQADPPSAKRIIEGATEQDPEFVYQVMRKVVFFEELLYLDETIISEILSKASPKILACALKEAPQEFKQKLTSFLGFRELRKLMQEEEELGDVVNKKLILGAQRQILKIARDLEANNKFSFEAPDCPRLNSRKKRA